MRGLRVEEPTLDLVYDKAAGSRVMGRVGRALVLHELLERTRDRWVIW